MKTCQVVELLIAEIGDLALDTPPLAERATAGVCLRGESRVKFAVVVIDNRQSAIRNHGHPLGFPKG